MVAIMASHISQINPRTASMILSSTLIDDSYHQNIMVAAGELVAYRLGHLVYHTQWASGTTAWHDTDKWLSRYVTVSRYGVVSRAGYYNG